MSPRILLAGVGNIFCSDDGFGVEVANLLAGRWLPPGVELVEFGIRGVHLAYQLLDGYDALVLVDAVPMGEPPGTLAVIEPQAADPGGAGEGDACSEGEAGPAIDAHVMGPDVVLGTLARLGGTLEKVYVVGCQPADLSEGMGLTPPVAAVVASAADLCVDLVSEMVQSVTEGRAS